MASHESTPSLPSRTQNLTGQRFGSLVVVTYLGTRHGRSFWQCLCDCGRLIDKAAKNLLRNKTKSCGCQYRTMGISPYKRKENAVLYGIFKHMWARCTNPNDAGFSYYGSRGITVDCRWKNFDTFVADMGPRPTPLHSLDRRDNDGPYSKENCRWASKQTQGNNTRRNHVVTLNNETLTVAEWARKTGIPAITLLMRLRHGWTVSDALLSPVMNRSEAASKLVTWGNETRSIKDWAAIVGLNRTTLVYRLNHGWTLYEALTQPRGKRGIPPGLDS